MHTTDTPSPESITHKEITAVLSKTRWLTRTQVLQAINAKRTEQGESQIPDEWKYRKRIKDLLETRPLRGIVSAVNITQLEASPNYDKKAVEAERARLRKLIQNAEDAMRETSFTEDSFDLFRLIS